MRLAGFTNMIIKLRDPRANGRHNADFWHRDSGGSPITLVLWSNIRPTQVRFTDGSLLKARAGDVMLIDNVEVQHRAPSNQRGRWFIRARLKKD